MMLLKPVRQVVALALLHISYQLMAADLPPLADVHLHFNTDQMEVTDTSDALRTLTDNNVVFGVVSSKPPARTLA